MDLIFKAAEETRKSIGIAFGSIVVLLVFELSALISVLNGSVEELKIPIVQVSIPSQVAFWASSLLLLMWFIQYFALLEEYFRKILVLGIFGDVYKDVLKYMNRNQLENYEYVIYLGIKLPPVFGFFIIEQLAHLAYLRKLKKTTKEYFYSEAGLALLISCIPLALQATLSAIMIINLWSDPSFEVVWAYVFGVGLVATIGLLFFIYDKYKLFSKSFDLRA